MCKNSISDSKTVNKVKMHHTKCENIVKNVIAPYFNEDLISDLSQGRFSLLQDESNDITINMLLRIIVSYYSRLKGIHSRSDTNRTGAEGLSFYYPRLLHCLNQMLAVMLLSQHRVSSSKTVRPRAPCGARCIGHAVRTWSAVCSEAPHSQFSMLCL